MSKCPKNMLNGPCGGYRGSYCEVSGECVWVKAFAELPPELRHEAFTKLNLNTFFKVRNYTPPPRRASSDVMRLIEDGKRVLIYEVFTSPSNKDVSVLITELKTLSPYVHAYAFVDSPMGIVTYEPLLLALFARNETRRDVVVNIASRNKSRDELTRYVLTSLDVGIRNYIIITGDWPRHSESAFFELDSTQLLYLCRLLSDLGIDYRGKHVGVGPRPAHFGIAVNQYSKLIELEVLRSLRKLNAGADFIVTQPVYSTRQFNLVVSEVVRRSRYDVKVFASYALIDNVNRLNMLEELGIVLEGDEKKFITSMLSSYDIVTANVLILERILKDIGDSISGLYISTYGNNVLAWNFLNRVGKLL